MWTLEANRNSPSASPRVYFLLIWPEASFRVVDFSPFNQYRSRFLTFPVDFSSLALLPAFLPNSACAHGSTLVAIIRACGPGLSQRRGRALKQTDPRHLALYHRPCLYADDPRQDASFAPSRRRPVSKLRLGILNRCAEAGCYCKDTFMWCTSACSRVVITDDL